MINFAFGPEDLPEGFDFESLFNDDEFLNSEGFGIEIIENCELSDQDNNQDGSQAASDERYPEVPTFRIEIWANRNPDNPDVYYFIALYYSASGKPNIAKEYYRQAVSKGFTDFKKAYEELPPDIYKTGLSKE